MATPEDTIEEPSTFEFEDHMDHSAGGDATVLTEMPLDERVGTVLVGRYEILRVIGTGGVAKVYEALDQRDGGRRCALKILMQSGGGGEWVERFAREIRIISSLDSPHIVKVQNAGRLSNGRPFLVEELLLGDTLGSIVAQGPMAPRRATWVLDGILAALDDAHQAGIVHRDLKPDNVFLTELGSEREKPKILDFGFAINLASAGDRRLTAAGMAVGTPRYMSPEQFLQIEVDGRADLYAAGALFYTMLRGRTPFDENDPVPERVAQMPFGPRLGWMHLNLAPPPIAGLPASLQTLLDRLLAKSPEDRYPTAAEARADLRLLVKGQRTPGPAVAQSQERRAAPRPRAAAASEAASAPTLAATLPPDRRTEDRRSVLIGLAAGALIGAAVAGLWLVVR